MTETTDKESRCGYVAIIGAPNAGKSTLLNRILGQKLAIVSPKAQTTRHRTLGIYIADKTQILFLDTPGLFTPKRKMERAMIASAWGAVADANAVILLVDAADKQAQTHNLPLLTELRAIAGKQKTILLCFNKVDSIKPERLLPLTAKFNQDQIFTATFMISATQGEGVDDLMRAVARFMPQGPWLYPEEQVTDQSERLLAAEITREQLYHQLRQELPYAATVATESWEEFDNGSVKITQSVIVAREGHKPIVLGKGGTRIKAIGEAARQELTELLQRRVHLMLQVKVREKWDEDPNWYRERGLDAKA